MNRILWFLLGGLLLSLVSCSESLGLDASEADGKVRLSFSLGGALEPAVKSRAMGEMTEDKRKNLDVWLLVFDKEGFLVETAQAKEQENSGDETTFSVDLSISTQKRIIHFVAVDTDGTQLTRTEWDQKMRDLPYGHETNVVRDLTVPYPVDAYWQREETPTINADTKFKRVPLVRNFAKVEIKSVVDRAKYDFVFEGFCVCNVEAEGSVAPYNTDTGEFVDYLQTASETSKTYVQLNSEGYYGAIPNEGAQNVQIPDDTGGDCGLTFDLEPKYLYETHNSSGDFKGSVYVLVKGRFEGHASSYYKVDLVKRGDEGMIYYDVLRNIFYTGEIQGVTANGYSSAKAASEAAASNNISASTSTGDVPNISDSEQRLFVSTTFLPITANQPVTMRFRYIPDLNEETTMNNGRVSYSYSGDGFLDEQSFTVATSDDADGWREITLTPRNELPVGGAVQTGMLHFYVKQEDNMSEILTRDVTIIYRAPYLLAVDCPDEVDKASQTSVTVTLQIDKNFNEKMFPLTFQVEATPKTLYPDVSKNKLPVQLGKSLADDATNSFYYEKTITWDEYGALIAPAGKNYKELPCYFLTNCESNAATVYAANVYCNKASDQFINYEPVLVSVDFDDIVKAVGQTGTLTIQVSRTGQPLTVTFTENGVVTTQKITPSSTTVTIPYTAKTADSPVTAEVKVDGREESLSATAGRIASYVIQGKMLKFTYQSFFGTSNVSNGTITFKANGVEIGSGTTNNQGVITSALTLTGAGLTTETIVTMSYSTWFTSYTRTVTLGELLSLTSQKTYNLN